MARRRRTPEPLRFVLVRRDVTGEAHSLDPELTRGPALCGLQQPSRDWVFAGFTIHPDQRVDCDRCRDRALTMRTAWTEGAWQ